MNPIYKALAELDAQTEFNANPYYDSIEKLSRISQGMANTPRLSEARAPNSQEWGDTLSFLKGGYTPQITGDMNGLARLMEYAKQDVSQVADFFVGGLANYADKANFNQEHGYLDTGIAALEASPITAGLAKLSHLSSPMVKSLGNTISDDMLTTPMRNQLGMITWQGSPHKYDGILDPTKIGSGEGAQAYGYGHYLAESPDVAKSYAEALAAQKNLNIPSTRPINSLISKPEQEAVNAANRAMRDNLPSRIQEKGGKFIPRYTSYHSYYNFRNDIGYYDDLYMKQHGGDVLEEINKLKELKQSKPKEFEYFYGENFDPESLKTPYRNAYLEASKAFNQQGGGHLYKFDLDDNAIERMLDWDAPLSEQPEAVRNALRPAFDRYKESIAGGEIQYYRPPVPAAERHGGIVDADKHVVNYKMPNGQFTFGSGNSKQEAIDNALSGLIDEQSITGGSFYERLARLNDGSDGQLWGRGSPQTSYELQKLGIPGIKYFDGSSRTAGEGTRNFVVFPGNENLVTPLERNGEPLGILPKR